MSFHNKDVTPRHVSNIEWSGANHYLRATKEVMKVLFRGNKGQTQWQSEPLGLSQSEGDFKEGSYHCCTTCGQCSVLIIANCVASCVTRWMRAMWHHTWKLVAGIESIPDFSGCHSIVGAVVCPELIAVIKKKKNWCILVAPEQMMP